MIILDNHYETSIMLRTTISILILLSLASIAYSQLESLAPLDYEIKYKTEDSFFLRLIYITQQKMISYSNGQ